MNGAEHYRAAQKLLSQASHSHSKEDLWPRNPVNGADLDPVLHASLIARAQVHATLALAAASAMPAVLQMMGDDQEVTEWGKAIGWATAGRAVIR